jgi:hypothetical protein
MWGYILSLVISLGLIIGGSVGTKKDSNNNYIYVTMIVVGAIGIISTGFVAYYLKE